MSGKGQAAIFLFMMVFLMLVAYLAFQMLSAAFIKEGPATPEPELGLVVPTGTFEPSPTAIPTATETPIQVAAPSPVVIVEATTPTPEERPEVALTATAVWETLLTPQALATPTQGPTGSPPPAPTWEQPTPAGNYAFLPDGEVRPDAQQGCLVGAIYGLVHDANGAPLEGVRVRIQSEWTEPQVVATKGSADGYRYNAIVSTDVGVRYMVAVVDEKGQPLSPEVQVVRVEGEPACWFEVNWRRAF